jgi:hypothetical protein
VLPVVNVVMSLDIELLDHTRIQLNVAVLTLGLLILLVGVLRDFLNAKVPASAVCMEIEYHMSEAVYIEIYPDNAFII